MKKKILSFNCLSVLDTLKCKLKYNTDGGILIYFPDTTGLKKYTSTHKSIFLSHHLYLYIYISLRPANV